MAAGPHPRRELTPMLPSDLLTPRDRMAAALSFLLAARPHPRRELTPMLPSDFLTPRVRLAAGAHPFYWRRASPPREAQADALPRIRHHLGIAWPQALIYRWRPASSGRPGRRRTAARA